jgi:hypothetical protein
VAVDEETSSNAVTRRTERLEDAREGGLVLASLLGVGGDQLGEDLGLRPYTLEDPLPVFV